MSSYRSKLLASTLVFLPMFGIFEIHSGFKALRAAKKAPTLLLEAKKGILPSTRDRIDCCYTMRDPSLYPRRINDRQSVRFKKMENGLICGSYTASSYLKSIRFDLDVCYNPLKSVIKTITTQSSWWLENHETNVSSKSVRPCPEKAQPKCFSKG